MGSTFFFGCFLGVLCIFLGVLGCEFWSSGLLILWFYVFCLVFFWCFGSFFRGSGSLILGSWNLILEVWELNFWILRLFCCCFFCVLGVFLWALGA